MSTHHITNSRHTITLLPLIVFLTGYAATRLFPSKAVLKTALLLLLCFSVFHTYNMPDYRQMYNAPRGFRKLAEIIKLDNSQGRTLCINSIDALKYTQKPVIWPTFNLADSPTEILEERDKHKFYSLLKKYNIDYIILWQRFIGGDYFARNYPNYFNDNCRELVRLNKLDAAAISESRAFLLLKVN